MLLKTCPLEHVVLLTSSRTCSCPIALRTLTRPGLDAGAASASTAGPACPHAREARRHAGRPAHASTPGPGSPAPHAHARGWCRGSAAGSRTRAPRPPARGTTHRPGSQSARHVASASPRACPRPEPTLRSPGEAATWARDIKVDLGRGHSPVPDPNPVDGGRNYNGPKVEKPGSGPLRAALRSMVCPPEHALRNMPREACSKRQPAISAGDPPQLAARGVIERDVVARRRDRPAVDVGVVRGRQAGDDLERAPSSSRR